MIRTAPLPKLPDDSEAAVLAYADAVLAAAKGVRYSGPGWKASRKAYRAALHEAKAARSLDRRRN